MDTNRPGKGGGFVHLVSAIMVESLLKLNYTFNPIWVIFLITKANQDQNKKQKRNIITYDIFPYIKRQRKQKKEYL